MPSKSKKQARFMTIASHDATFAKRNNIPQDVAKEFHEADKAKAKSSQKPNKSPDKK